MSGMSGVTGTGGTGGTGLAAGCILPEGTFATEAASVNVQAQRQSSSHGTEGNENVVSDPLEALLAGLRLAVDRVLRQVHGAAGSGGPDADAERLSRVSDWDAVAALAGRHGVVGLFLHGLHARPELAGRPEVGALRRLRDRRLLRSGRRLRGLQRADAVLADVGVDRLVLKGVPLSQRLYGHPLLRSSADVDLLVAPADARPAEKALLRAGWRRGHSADVEGGPGAAFQRYLKHRALVGPDGLVELHHRLVSNPSFLDVRFEDLWAGRETVRLGSASFAVLGSDDDFLYNTCHALRHGWADLKWLCDAGVALGLAAANPGAFERLRSRFRAGGLEAALECVALLCREHLHVRLPARLPAGGRAVFVSRRIVGRGWSKTKRPGTDRARGKAAALLLGPGAGSAAGELASMAAVRLAPAAGHPRVRGLRAFMRAPAATRRMALEAAFFLLVARLFVAYAPGRRWRRWAVTAEGEGTAAASSRPRRPVLPSSRPVARRIGRIVPRVAAGAPFEAACLPQALAARWMLRRRGVASRLCFGVRRPPGADLQFHAWLTTEGEGVVGCREAETYRVFTASTAAWLSDPKKPSSPRARGRPARMKHPRGRSLCAPAPTGTQCAAEAGQWSSFQWWRRPRQKTDLAGRRRAPQRARPRAVDAQ